MEGFVAQNSVFETKFRRSTNYANYGAEKIYNGQNIQNKNQNANPLQNGYYGQSDILGGINSDDFKNAFDQDFIDSTINHFDKSVVDTITNDKDDNKHRLRKAFIVGVSTLLFGGITLLLTRGKMSKNAFEIVNKLNKSVTEKISEIKAKPEMSRVESIHLSALQIADKASSRVKGTLFNISPLKDVLFEKLVREKLGLGKVCDYITNGFKKVSFGTVKSFYKSAARNLNSMTGTYSDINARIASGEFGAVDKSVVDKLNKGVRDINKLYTKSFSESCIDKRSDSLSKKFHGLGKKVYSSVYGNMKEFITDTDNWSTFISERLVAGQKAKVMENLYSKKRVISNAPKDVYNALTDTVAKLEKVINPNEKGAREVVKKVKELSKIYLNPSLAENPQSREEIVRDIQKVISEYSSAIKGGSSSDTQKQLLNQIEDVLKSDKKGIVEELLTIYKKILPQSEYEAVKKATDKATKSLNKAVYNEGYNYTDKLRDLSVGSALTDVAIGTAMPLIATGIAISAADTKEKKRSVLLKYGIPLMVGIATTTTCALRLIAGGKALILGAITSTITNNICERIDKKLKDKDKIEQGENTASV